MMKKYFILSCIAGLAMSASANGIYLGDINVRLTNEIKISQELSSNEIFSSYAKRADAPDVSHLKQAPRRAATAKDIEGDWLFQMGSYFNDPIGIFNVPYLAQIIDGDVIMFYSDSQAYYPMATLFTPAKSELQFMREQIATAQLDGVGKVYIFQEPFIYDFTTDNADMQNITGVYNQEAGTISFAPNAGIAWSAFISESATDADFVGYINNLILEGAKSEDAIEKENTWINAGTATLMDGWVLPGAGIDQTLPENQYDVPLEVNMANDNLFRLVNPYQYGPAAELNTSEETGYIVFDVSDPDHVMFKKANAGFATNGIPAIYCYNNSGYYYNYVLSLFGMELSPTEAAQYAGEPYTTYKDGIITLSHVEEQKNGKTQIHYDASFGIPGTSTELGDGHWTNSNGTARNMDASITLHIDLNGVTEIDTDETAEPVYYNLNGLRVTNPEKGQLLIVRKGSKTEKVLFGK